MKNLREGKLRYRIKLSDKQYDRTWTLPEKLVESVHIEQAHRWNPRICRSLCAPTGERKLIPST